MRRSPRSKRCRFCQLISAFALFVCAAPASAATHDSHIDLVRVVKSEHRLYLMSHGRIVETFHVALGRHPVGTKQQEGDGRTPEGRYLLDYRNAASAFHKSIHVSYPNSSDQTAAKRRGVQPGGMIMLHGQKNGWGMMGAATQRMDWTDGCIALTDQEMDRVWKQINVPTPIQIDP